jgi:hypothetical protein
MAGSMMDEATRDLLRGSLGQLLATSTAEGFAADLQELGWDDVLAEDPVAARSILFETKGEVLSSVDALGAVLADAVGAPGATVVLPASLHPDRPSSSLRDGGLVIDGAVLTSPSDGAALVVPVADASGGVRLAHVAATAGLARQALGGFDPGLALTALRGSVPGAEVEWLAPSWVEAVAAGRWCVALELVGIGRRVIADAVAYTSERHQYGRPIGSFQAIQHRLAAGHSALVGASHVAHEAARSGSPWAATVAKALAGHAAEDACTHAQQSYGAIGFTWEHPFHRALRRVYVLDRLLGGWRELEPEIGAQLQAAGEVPRIGAL